LNHDDDDSDNASIPDKVDPDAVVNGASADSSDSELDRLKGLPRILRYAMLSKESRDDLVAHRLVAEIDELYPNLPQNAVWAAKQDAETGRALAVELDRLAVITDLPLLRSLSDCVRLLSLSVPNDFESFGAFRRVTRAMIHALHHVAATLDDRQCADLEELIYGFAALPAANGLTDGTRHWPAITSAVYLGDRSARYRIRAAVVDAMNHVRRDMEPNPTVGPPPQSAADATMRDPLTVEPTAEHHVVVGRVTETEMKTLKLTEPFKHILRTLLPLVQTPPLDRVRAALIAEFPYAVDVIDFTLTDLVSHPTVRLRPLLLVGEPGAGKSRFARRLGEVLGLTIWRTDAAQSDGNAFSGTDRRWNTAQPCHPFLAIARGKTANPLVLIDEIEKTSTRNDYGRLWDCLLGFLEPETSARYPDPALQIALDLSHVSYVATANTLDPLPSPLRDRFRIIAFPKPTSDDLDALLPGLLDSLAVERGIDSRWIAPLDAYERASVKSAWPGGSVRRLRLILEIILQVRDRTASRQ
jgi:ATP-dependent Lon protease